MPAAGFEPDAATGAGDEADWHDAALLP